MTRITLTYFQVLYIGAPDLRFAVAGAPLFLSFIRLRRVILLCSDIMLRIVIFGYAEL